MADLSEQDKHDVDNAPEVTGEPLGGSSEGGKAIVVGFPMKDGTKTWVSFRQELLARILHAMRNFGAMAERARAGNNVKNVDTITDPYLIRAMPRIGRSRDGKAIAIQFLTVDGFPVSVAMPREGAAQFADHLKAQATRPLAANG